MFTKVNKRHRTLLLPLFGLSLVAGLTYTPDCNDGVWEVFYDQETYFNCTAEGEVQWRLRLSDNTSPITLGVCDKNCNMLNTFEGLYTARITDVHKTTMIIKPANNRKVYDDIELVNGSLECSHGDDHAGCRLNFVGQPQNVSCKAYNTSWLIDVFCVIETVYSSRKMYTCSLIRTQMSKNEMLETVTMVTLPTSEKITKGEVKVSGSCRFTTTLPREEGNYGFLVSVSPGRRKFMTDKKNFTVERPRSPTALCGPQSYVLENTTVTCTCSTTSLGQPAGYLRWVTGNQRDRWAAVPKEKQEFTSKGLQYGQVLTLSDHGSTWLRCDIIWGTEEIPGKKYTAIVGYAPKTPHLSFNGLERNQRVKERDQVNFRCESDGRPKPNVSIYNNDNDTVIIRASSPVIYMFIARCEDTAIYTCSARNEFSSLSGVTASLKMEVNCKPRILSSTHPGTIKSRSKTQELSFDIIAYPVPYKYEVWYVLPVMNNSEPFSGKVEGSELNVTCKASEKSRYLSRCTLPISDIPSRSGGLYKVYVINEHGEENFSVEISYAAYEDLDSFNPAVIYGIVSLVVFISGIVALIAVIRKVKKSKDILKLLSRPACEVVEVIFVQTTNKVVLNHSEVFITYMQKIL